MSLLPGQIIPQHVPFGKVNEDGTVTIDQNWWLLIYNLVLKTLGTGTSPADDQAVTTEVDDATDDGNDVRPAVADLERALSLDEPQTTSAASDITELQALTASFAEDPIIARFTAQWDGLTPASGGGTTKFMRADGAWAVPAYPTVPVGANPTASVGLTAVNGSAATFMRSDGAPPLDVTISPTWTGIHLFENAAAALRVQLLASSGFGIARIQDEAGTRKLEMVFCGSTSAGAYGAAAGTCVINAGGGLTLSVADTAAITLDASGNTKFVARTGFNNTAPIAKPTVTGSKGANAALASLLTALANYGLVTDSST